MEMRAVVTEDYGKAPTVTTMPAPTAAADEVRVRVRSSSLNGFDIALAHGHLKGLMEHRFPVILGRDFAGTVDQVGDAVTGFAVGDDVFGVVLTQPLAAGGFAEYLTVPAEHSIASMPAGLDHATAGALGLAGAAAVGALGAVTPGAGDTVLVSGATGGVGAFAIQLAARAGATVIATAVSNEEQSHVRSLGATYAVDHADDLVAQVRAIAPAGVTAALHLAGDPMVVAGLVAPGGRFASLLGVGPDQLPGRDVVATSVIASPRRDLLADLADEVVAGRLRVPVLRTYALADVPRAFADFAAGTMGKLAVSLD
jgi:NADPH:quinone reductase-like Zn-dependent oxidoreductase